MNKNILVVIVAVGYSFIRYAWAKEVPPTHWPSFVANKALAFCAVSFFVLACWDKIRASADAGQYFRNALTTALVHGIVSVALLQPAYYKFLYLDSGKFNVYGEWTLVFGALGLALFLTASREVANRFSRDLLVFAVLLSHVIGVGILKWLDPNRWTYGLVPISLVSCSVLLTGLVLVVRHRIRQSDVAPVPEPAAAEVADE